MRTVAAFFVCSAAALLAILLASSSPHAQPVTGGAGLTRVARDSSLTGSGTSTAPLGIRRDCAASQVLTWNGTAWACTTPSVATGDIEGVTAGSGLTGGGTTGTVTVDLGVGAGLSLGADAVTLALGVQDCAAGSFFDSNTTTGTFTCVAEVGDISGASITANMGLTGGGTSGAVSFGMLSTCADGQVLKSGATGTTWTCANDTGGITNSAGANIVMKSDGTNAVASTITDTGSLVTVASLTRIDIGTSGAVAALAGSTLIVEGAAATHNYFSMLSDNGVNGGILFNTPTAAADGYLLYDGTARRLGFAAGALQVLQITAATTSIFNNTAIGDAGTDTLTVAATATFTPLVTATGGVTTPANLTTTSSGALVVAGTGAINGSGLTVAGTLNVTGQSAFTALATASGGLTSTAGATKVGNFSGQRIAASLTANVNDWAPAGLSTAMVIDLTSVSAGPFAILGIDSTGSVAGRVLVLLNNGGNTFQVNNEAGTSIAANRIKTTGGATRTIGNYGSMSIVWNGTNWSEIAEASRFTPELYSLGALQADGVTQLIGNVTTYANSVFGDAGGDTHTVNGSMTITNGLTVQSSGVLIQSGLTVNDNVILGSASTTTTKMYRPETTGTAPTPSACGTTPTSTGGLWAIKMTLGTGTAASCTVALPFTASPICTLGSEITTRGDLVISALSATSITVTSVSGVNMASGKINVICVGDG